MAPCLRSASALLLLLLPLLGLLSPAAAVQTRVRSRGGGERRGARSAALGRRTRRLQAVLRTGTAGLRRAIWEELGLEPERPLTRDLAATARALLAREADYFAAEDGAAASALRDYARGAFLPLLAMPLEPPALLEPLPRPEPASLVVPWLPAAPAVPRELRTVESSETVVQHGARGELVRTTRRCQMHSCVTQTEEISPEAFEEARVEGDERRQRLDEEDAREVPAAQEEEEPEAADEAGELAVYEPPQERALGTAGSEAPQDVQAAFDSAVASAADALGSGLRVAARRMARFLKRATEGSGLPPLSEMVERLVNSSALPGDSAQSLSSVNRTEAARLLNTSAAGDVLDGFLDGYFMDLANAIAPGTLTNASSLLGPAFVDSESVSTVETVVNGHLVRQVRRCKRGQCTTTSEEDEAASGKTH